MSNTEIEVAHVCIYTISGSRVRTARNASALLNGIVSIDSHLLQCFQTSEKAPFLSLWELSWAFSLIESLSRLLIQGHAVGLLSRGSELNVTIV
jgi:hypothetical protein